MSISKEAIFAERLRRQRLLEPVRTPEQDAYVSVIGISSLYVPEASGLRLVLPRSDSGICPY